MRDAELGFYGGFLAALAMAVAMKADVTVDMSNESKVLAKYGKLDAHISCTEQAAASKKIANYFAGKAKDGFKNPDFTITKEECEAVMAARRTARLAAPVAKP